MVQCTNVSGLSKTLTITENCSNIDIASGIIILLKSKVSLEYLRITIILSPIGCIKIKVLNQCCLAIIVATGDNVSVKDSSPLFLSLTAIQARSN